MTTQQRNKTIRNIIIFYVGTILLSTGGGFIMASGQDAGGLLFILSPLLMVFVVRFLLGDGWKDAGLELNIKKSWGWYLFALLMYPIFFAVIITVNVLLGFTTLTMSISEMLPVVLTGFGMQFIARMLFSLSEEWAWRGYLEPRFTSLGLPDLRRHLIVGVLWAVWHFPLILSTDYTSVSLGIFLPLFVIDVILMAIVFGQIRKASGSVWTLVLLHGMGNAVGYAILEGKLMAFNNELFGNIVPGSITVTLLLGLITLFIWQRSHTKQSQEAEQQASV